MKRNISAGTIARTICLFVALLNQIFVIFSISPIPIEDETWEILVSTIATIITALVAWWKNNSFSKNAIEADEKLAKLRSEKNA